ncbi:MAG: ATP-grasp domain-containing protein [Gammaproteobacteria bacterium]|nr:ATP-grasp domain-containing protein [Gammaproteobacteria bacterium]
MRILFINLGWEQTPLIDLISLQDVELYGVHYNSDYYKGVKYRDILISDLRDLPRILRYAEKIRPDAVISDQCDYSQFVQAVISQKMGLPGPKVRSAQIANNKVLQRQLAKECGMTSPEFSCCLCVEEAIEAAEKFGYPVMIKPPDNRGSFGVNKADSASDVEAYFYEALVESHSRTVLVERFIDGRHITVDGYVFKDHGPKALALATKDKLKEKNSIIDGEITYPGELDEDIYLKALRNLENIATKFGFSFGFLHGEFIVTSEGDVYLTEIANRGGGVFTSEIIVPQVCGLDIMSIYVNDCIGRNLVDVSYDVSQIQRTPTLLKFFAFSDNQKGIVKRIEGIDKLSLRKDVLKIKMLIHSGDVIGGISSGADRHGMIIVTGNSLEDARAELATAIDMLEVTIEGN